MLAEKQSKNGTQRDACPTLTLRDFMLGALADCVKASLNADPELAENRILQGWLDKISVHPKPWEEMLVAYLDNPRALDEPLIFLAYQIRLTMFELMCVVLAIAVEEDAFVGRILTHLQAPLGRSRPTVGLLTMALASVVPDSMAASTLLINGNALQSRLLNIGPDDVPLPEKTVALPDHCRLALAGYDGSQRGMAIGMPVTNPVPLPESFQVEIEQWGKTISTQQDERSLLVIRSGSRAERRTVAQAIANQLDMRPVFIETDQFGAMSPWLILRRLLPVFCVDLPPGERKKIPIFPFYFGPTIVVMGLEGGAETLHDNLFEWRLSVPNSTEREKLWQVTLRNKKLSRELAQHHRHRTGRIAHLGRLARQLAIHNGRKRPNLADIQSAAWTAEGGGIENLAQPLNEDIPEDALVVTKKLKEELENLLMRCRARDGLVDGLGASAVARYKSGVRALMVGPSGTGKTLAAGWLANRLGIPLYRVDMASISSKYIGETEKNLAQLLSQAEQSEMILLFDEADSLFGKRTEVNQANDRFANAQTNYLLQRMESFDGIALLTSNSKSRFDAAFSRRLDMIVEFPIPGPQERRRLWQSHLGDKVDLSAKQFSLLASSADLTGGHIRNVVLGAAVIAHEGKRSILFDDILRALDGEYRKLSKQLPTELKRQRLREG